MFAATVCVLVFLLVVVDVAAMQVVRGRFEQAHRNPDLWRSLEWWEAWLRSDVRRVAMRPLGAVWLLLTYHPTPEATHHE